MSESRGPGRPLKEPSKRRTNKAPVKVYLTDDQRKKLDWLKGGSSNSTYLARLIDRMAEEDGYPG